MNLESFKKQFRYYKLLGDKTFEQLEEKDLFWQFNSESNSIGVMVKHLHGNMLSRWTDFLNSDGEKEWRNRDYEFKTTFISKTDMLSKWEEGWACLFEALDTVNPHCSTSDTKRPLADRKLTNPLSVEVLRHFFIEKCL